MLVEQALALLDEAGEGGSLAAINLQSALTHLGKREDETDLDVLAARLWPDPPPANDVKSD